MGSRSLIGSVSGLVLSLFLSHTSCFAQVDATGNSQKETIKIGLLIADSTEVEAKYGAELAVREINLQGGIKGHKLELLTRSMEGSWGRGSTQAVDLIFDDEVYAILGAHKGRNAHLVEQVIAKTKITFLSAWAADPTLSKAYVPWYFSCVPNSDQQMEVLHAALRSRKDVKRWVVVTGADYDSDLAFKSLVQKNSSEQNLQIRQVRLDQNPDFSKIMERIGPDADLGLVMLTDPKESWGLINFLHSNHKTIPVYASLSLLGEKTFEFMGKTSPQNVFAINNGNWFYTQESSFVSEFKEVYGRIPGAMSVYSYDGLMMLSMAIEASGLNKDKVYLSLGSTIFKGKTGTIEFDERGNRIGLPDLLEIKAQKMPADTH